MLGLCHYPVANLRSQLPISLAEISFASVRFPTLNTPPTPLSREAVTGVRDRLLFGHEVTYVAEATYESPFRLKHALLPGFLTERMRFRDRRIFLPATSCRAQRNNPSTRYN